MTCIIIDDEKTSILALAAKIKMADPRLEIIGTYLSAEEAMTALATLAPDIAFLDIDMPGLDGLSLLRSQALKGIFTILTTAHTQYMLDGWRAYAFDFLVKPVDVAELAQSLKRVAEKYHEPIPTNQPLSMAPPFVHLAQKIPITSAKGVQFIPINDIIWLKSEGNYTVFYLSNNKNLVATKGLKAFEALLAPLGFLRVHHSALVNSTHILGYTRGEGGTLQLSYQYEVEVSKRKKSEVLAYLGL